MENPVSKNLLICAAVGTAVAVTITHVFHLSMIDAIGVGILFGIPAGIVAAR